MNSPRFAPLKYIPSAVVLGIIILFTYGNLFIVPYLGFHFNHVSGQISAVFSTSESNPTLEVGDFIQQIDGTTFKDYLENPHLALIEDGYPGKRVSIIIRRNSQLLAPITWELPGASFDEISIRLVLIWVPYVLWFMGTLAILLVRPLEERAWMYIAFCFVSALWIMFGLSSWLWFLYAPLLLRILVWIAIPIYLHFHWVFPESLGRISKPLVIILYAAGLSFAVAEWFNMLPQETFSYGLLVSFVGSLLLLGIHALRSPEQRRDLSIFGFVILLALLPSVIGTILLLTRKLPFYGISFLIFAPTIPTAYFLILYRREDLAFDRRAPRAIGLLLFSVVLLSILMIFVPFFFRIENTPGREVPITLEMILFINVLVMLTYPNFQNWVERRLLRMPVPAKGLLEAYSDRIITSLEIEQLVHLLKDEILPSILVRQAVLLDLEEKPPAALLTLGLGSELSSGSINTESLIKSTGTVLKIKEKPANRDPSASSWVRVVLPLKVENKLVGLLLLGDRGIDNVYPVQELPALQALANQTALALMNIHQAERLHALYQQDIQRTEAERSKLARELHDVVLQRLVDLARIADANNLNSDYFDQHEHAIETIRGLISGLRPSTLHFGLRIALEEIVDEVALLGDGSPRMEIDLPPVDHRYPHEIELQVYRIVQQACQNAVKHANARKIRITGDLEEQAIALVVEDDGSGFRGGEILDLDWLLSNRHYGLAGMHERASLIGADMVIKTQPGKGTRIQLKWASKNGFEPGTIHS